MPMPLTYKMNLACYGDIANISTHAIKLTLINNWRALQTSVANVHIRIYRDNSQISDIAAVSLH